ncbi:CcmD family protein [Methanonatronarchaeum sp. AMET6-2]|nr:MAG: CcmD family protein [Methanonatronarchaeia archaeon]
MEPLYLLFTAYLLVWIVISGYIYWIKNKQDRIKREIEALESEA